jgi:hypothetical protein
MGDWLADVVPYARQPCWDLAWAIVGGVVGEIVSRIFGGRVATWFTITTFVCAFFVNFIPLPGWLQPQLGPILVSFLAGDILQWCNRVAPAAKMAAIEHWPAAAYIAFLGFAVWSSIAVYQTFRWGYGLASDWPGGYWLIILTGSVLLQQVMLRHGSAAKFEVPGPVRAFFLMLLHLPGYYLLFQIIGGLFVDRYDFRWPHFLLTLTVSVITFTLRIALTAKFFGQNYAAMQEIEKQSSTG